MSDGVEVGCKSQVVGEFRKASGSTRPDECVAVAKLDNGGRAVSHSRFLGSAQLNFTPAEWQRFIDGVKAGEFDL